MCGIFGIVGSANENMSHWIDAALDSLAHRGPDDRGVWHSAEREAFLAHRRLSVIDTSSHGHQPFASSTGKYVLVFNGEIYNFAALRTDLVGRGHSFHSSSDTEVLLACYEEWGKGCLDRLNGMFAFAVYDREKQLLFCARDRIGEKPFYYRQSSNGLVFASEVKALLLDPEFQPSVDEESLQFYLAFGHTPPDATMVRDIKKLRPGCWLEYRVGNNSLTSGRYWDLPSQASRVGEPRALTEELGTLLEEAVQRQLVADVPLGVLLSGGVDSSLIAALAAGTGKEVHTYTFAAAGEGEHDESDHARLIAEHFGTKHRVLSVAEPDVSILEQLSRQFDDPISDSSIIPVFLISREIRKYCTVAVGGDGGDELFGGYRRYNEQLSLQRYLGWMPFNVRKGLASVIRRVWPNPRRGRGHLRLLESPFAMGAAPLNYLAGPKERYKVTRLATNFDAESSMKKYYGLPPGLECLLRGDVATCLAEDYLVKVDRASMLNSLEVRSPLLDYKVVEFAFGRVPDNLKAHGGERKILLKRLGKEVLPKGFDFQRKQGFSVPLPTWLRQGEWRQRFKDELLYGDNAIVDSQSAGDLFSRLDSGENTAPQLFNLFMLESWCRHYRISL